MGSSASTASAANPNALANLKVNSKIDAYDGKMWWKASVLKVQTKKKPHYIRVVMENEHEMKILFGSPKLNKSLTKKIAALGTYTRENIASAAAKQLSESPTYSRLANQTKKEAEEKSDRVDSDTNSNNGSETSDEAVPSFSRNQRTRSWGKDDRCDVLDIYKSAKTLETTERWRKASIVRTNFPKVLINFEGWNDDNNIWINIDMEPHRISEFGQHTNNNNNGNGTSGSGSGGSETETEPRRSVNENTESTEFTEKFSIGTECYGKDEYISKKTMELAFTWRHACIIESSDNQVKLHFTDWHSRWDAWYEIDGKYFSLELLLLVYFYFIVFFCNHNISNQHLNSSTNLL